MPIYNWIAQRKTNHPGMLIPLRTMSIYISCPQSCLELHLFSLLQRLIQIYCFSPNMLMVTLIILIININAKRRLIQNVSFCFYTEPTMNQLKKIKCSFVFLNKIIDYNFEEYFHLEKVDCFPELIRSQTSPEKLSFTSSLNRFVCQKLGKTCIL